MNRVNDGFNGTGTKQKKKKNKNVKCCVSEEKEERSECDRRAMLIRDGNKGDVE